MHSKGEFCDIFSLYLFRGNYSCTRGMPSSTLNNQFVAGGFSARGPTPNFRQINPIFEKYSVDTRWPGIYATLAHFLFNFQICKCNLFIYRMCGAFPHCLMRIVMNWGFNNGKDNRCRLRLKNAEAKWCSSFWRHVDNFFCHCAFASYKFYNCILKSFYKHFGIIRF